jgi:hypothetical protein
MKRLVSKSYFPGIDIQEIKLVSKGDMPSGLANLLVSFVFFK